MRFVTRNLPAIMLGILVALSLFVRLYRLSYTQTFLEDEGRDMLIVMRMVDTNRPVLLGPQTSIGSMYLGPFYYYFITPALLLSGMDPIGPAVLIAITGALTVYLLFRLTSIWFGNRAAWLAAILYAFMPLPVAFTRNSWNPDLAPLVALLIIWILDRLRVVAAKDIKWFAVLGFLTGILFQLHYMALVFVAIYCLLLLVWWRKSGRLFLAIAHGIVGFLLSISPFIIFELRNDWVNTRAITRFIEAKEAPNIRYRLPFDLWETKVTTVSTTLFGGLFSRGGYRPFDTTTGPITAIVIICLIVGITLAPIDRKRKLILGLTILGSVAVLGIYQENIHAHYLGYLFAVTYLGFVSLTANENKLLAGFGVLITVGLIAYSLPVMLGNIGTGNSLQVAKAREVATYIANRSAGRPYNIVSSSKTSSTPYQYFAFLNDNPPTNDWTETVFLICQDAPCSDGDIFNRQLFLFGPAHPSLSDYVGHPLANDLDKTIVTVNNDHVSNGIWVAELQLINP